MSESTERSSVQSRPDRRSSSASAGPHSPEYVPSPASMLDVATLAGLIARGPMAANGVTAIKRDAIMWLQRTHGNAHVGRVLSNSSAAAAPSVHRAAVFSPGILETFSPIKAIEKGVAGSTSPVLNGERLGSGGPKYPKPLKKPQLATRELPDGSAESSVAGLPTNEATVEMRVPNPNGPWTTTRPKSVMASGEFGGLQFPGCAEGGAGETEVQIHGNPSSEAVAAGTMQHERRHANDDRDVFHRVAGTWDHLLGEAQNDGRTFTGAGSEASEAALYQAMGGSPQVVADRLVNEWDEAGHQFHDQPAGRGLNITGLDSDKACTKCTIQVE